MSKNTLNKAHMHSSLASKIWEKIKHPFQKTTVSAINTVPLALIEDEPAMPSIATGIATGQEYTEFEVEISLEELQDVLTLLEQQNQNITTPDEVLKQLIDTLKKSEKKAKTISEKELMIELIPLPNPRQNPNQPLALEKEKEREKERERDREQREMAKKITHYPPSDRLH